MLQSNLFLVAAGIPIFLFLRRVRALKLSRGYALVLTVPIRDRPVTRDQRHRR